MCSFKGILRLFFLTHFHLFNQNNVDKFSSKNFQYPDATKDQPRIMGKGRLWVRHEADCG